jgi:hypothetical protein
MGQCNSAPLFNLSNMIQTILKINLNDDGGFYENLDISKLWLDSQITVMEGMFKKQSDTVFTNVIHETYDLTTNDKFYFLPGVTIPRMKLKDISNTHKIRTVRDMDAANRIFIGSKTIDKMTDETWECAATTASFTSFIDEAFKNKNIDTYYYEKIKDALEFYTNDLIVIDRYTYNMLRHHDIPYSVMDEWLDDGSNKFIFIKSDSIKLFKDLAGKEFYAEDSLMDYINGPDAVVIDEQMFDTLSDMFKSDDRENWTLAMEIMANCDYKKSLLYLTLLFHDHGNRMDNVSSRNHVNFKALTLYLNISGGLSIDPDEVVDILIAKNGVTKENMDIVIKLFGSRINTYGSSRHFGSKSVGFSPIVDKILNEEIVYTLKDDYQVEIPETPTWSQPVDETPVQEEPIVEPINDLDEPNSTSFNSFEL